MKTHLLIASMICGLVSGLPVRAQETETSAPRSEATVPEGINEGFKDPQLDVDQWLERFEVESREVYAARFYKPATSRRAKRSPMSVRAPVSTASCSPSGLAKAAGSTASTLPKFLQHIASRATADGIAHLTPVLGTDHSIRLPPGSVDLVFVSDTYHHFEQPSQMLATIYRALKPGGRFIVIDFERVPGVSRDWIIDHVRAGKEVFRDEIESAGFRYVDELEIEAFEENYLIRFVKPADGKD